MFEPIRTRTDRAEPADYILPVAYSFSSTADPLLVRYWHWIPPQSGTTVGYWALVNLQAKFKGAH